MDIFDINRPPWIRGKVPRNEDRERVESIVSDRGLHSVCVSAACPNKGECWKAKHVTFMILGDVCTRGCLFCNVSAGDPFAPDPQEPAQIAEAVKELGVKYAVITSVTRDDLTDKGASCFLETVKHIKNTSPETRVELLIPDLDASESLLQQIAFSGAEVIGHNIEMPERLYASIRPRADYQKSLRTLSLLAGMKKRTGILVKSSMITGLGEIGDDIKKTLNDLKGAGVDIVYIGQYLNPTKKHWPVKKYYTPEEFSALDAMAKDMGFKAVMAGPMVRSSYRAYEAYCEGKSIV
jgi:lipoic acid synthetase